MSERTDNILFFLFACVLLIIYLFITYIGVWALFSFLSWKLISFNLADWKPIARLTLLISVAISLALIPYIRSNI